MTVSPFCPGRDAPCAQTYGALVRLTHPPRPLTGVSQTAWTTLDWGVLTRHPVGPDLPKPIRQHESDARQSSGGQVVGGFGAGRRTVNCGHPHAGQRSPKVAATASVSQGLRNRLIGREAERVRAAWKGSWNEGPRNSSGISACSAIRRAVCAGSGRAAYSRASRNAAAVVQLTARVVSSSSRGRICRLPWHGSWHGGLSNPSPAGAGRAMGRAICAARAFTVPGRTSCKRQVAGSTPVTGSG
jgi:hypothetical protein